MQNSNTGMNTKKKVLVLGGTGAMGMYLVPALIEAGYAVDVYSMDDIKSENPDLHYYVRDCYDENNLRDILSKGYDCVIDFLLYGGWDAAHSFVNKYKLFLESTKHYIYLSSYRVYDDLEHPVRESSPRLLDVSTDYEFLGTNDYSLYKAKGENLLVNSGYKNFTIVRPSITFSKLRYQLVTLEAPFTVGRAFRGKKVILPRGAMDKQATLTWASDTAKFFLAVVLNEKAFGETYSFSTHEHYTWREIADIYHDICGLEYVEVDDDDFIDVIAHPDYRKGPEYQLAYDREFDRDMDNTKILELAGMKPSDVTPLRTALKYEIDRLDKTRDWENYEVNARMDAYLEEHGL